MGIVLGKITINGNTLREDDGEFCMPRLDNRGSCSTDPAASSVQGPTILYKDQGMEIEETDFQ